MQNWEGVGKSSLALLRKKDANERGLDILGHEKDVEDVILDLVVQEEDAEHGSRDLIDNTSLPHITSCDSTRVPPISCTFTIVTSPLLVFTRDFWSRTTKPNNESWFVSIVN